jgi:hypothetical protein
MCHTYTQVIALFMLSTLGEPIDEFPPVFTDVFSEAWPSSQLFGTPNGVLFTVLWVVWIFISLIMLLNLLIAQMSDVYESMNVKSTLEYRLGFARRVLRTELFTSRMIGLSRSEQLFRVGTEEPGSDPPVYYYTYREVGRNVEGRCVSNPALGGPRRVHHPRKHCLPLFSSEAVTEREISPGAWCLTHFG